MINLDGDIVKTNILSTFEDDWTKNLEIECKQDFSKIWPSDLLFYPTQPMIQHDRDIIKTYILSKFEEE